MYVCTRIDRWMGYEMGWDGMFCASGMRNGVGWASGLGLESGLDWMWKGGQDQTIFNIHVQYIQVGIGIGKG
jgi:hypothetical protein